jgi:hypothetical protein
LVARKVNHLLIQFNRINRIGLMRQRIEHISAAARAKYQHTRWRPHMIGQR